MYVGCCLFFLLLLLSTCAKTDRWRDFREEMEKVVQATGR